MNSARVRRLLRRLVVYPLATVAMLVAGGVAWYFATLYRAGAPHEGHLALTGATVLVGPDLEPRAGTTVLVRDGRIAQVAADDEMDIPADATVVDLAGSTLMPGLVDLHVHLGSPEREAGRQVGPLQMPGLVVDAVRFVPDTRRAFLHHGVTTVRSLGDDHQWVMDLRRGIRNGDLEGPRVFAAGPLFTTPNGHPVVTLGVEAQSDAVRLPSTPAEARRAVRELAGGSDGVDLIKVVQERGRPGRNLQPIAPDVLRAIVTEAHARDLAVFAHWGSPEDLVDVLAAGVDGLEHIEPRGVRGGWPDGTIDVLVERDISLTPTLAVTEVVLPPHITRQQRLGVAAFHSAGGRVVAGSDAGMPGVPFGGGLHRELRLLVDSGLSPQDALRAATSGAAHVLGADDIGIIEPGRAADLLVVRSDPLQRIGAVEDVVLVLRDGRIVVDNRG
jgi:imidazolonepropionase-like amidohydrolase